MEEITKIITRELQKKNIKLHLKEQSGDGRFYHRLYNKRPIIFYNNLVITDKADSNILPDNYRNKKYITQIITDEDFRQLQKYKTIEEFRKERKESLTETNKLIQWYLFN